MMHLYAGLILNPHDTFQPDNPLQYISDGCLIVDEKGNVVFVGNRTDASARFSHAQIHHFENCVIMPGLIDTHVHLPQYQAAAIGSGELLDWLNTYIFPLEARFADEQFAREQSIHFFQDALKNGTTTMSVYCSSHPTATKIAFEAAFEAGLRVCMGKTMMDMAAPDNILFSPQQNLKDSLSLAHTWHEKDGGRLLYTLTPRFAGSCSRDLLRQTGEIARAEGLRIQTHISENPAELRFIASLFPECLSYTDVYEQTGILTNKTILAHSIYLSDIERGIIRQHQCSIAHCPCSNRFLQSGVMALRRYILEGFTIGLGSDVAGGYSLSLLNEAREATESSKTWNIINRGEETPVVSPEESLWLATMGGAVALGLSDRTGNFREGKEADFIVLEMPPTSSESPLFADYSHLVARLVYRGESTRVLRTFVRGKELYHAE